MAKEKTLEVIIQAIDDTQHGVKAAARSLIQYRDDLNALAIAARNNSKAQQDLALQEIMLNERRAQTMHMLKSLGGAMAFGAPNTAAAIESQTIKQELQRLANIKGEAQDAMQRFEAASRRVAAGAMQDAKVEILGGRAEKGDIQAGVELKMIELARQHAQARSELVKVLNNEMVTAEQAARARGQLKVIDEQYLSRRNSLDNERAEAARLTLQQSRVDVLRRLSAMGNEQATVELREIELAREHTIAQAQLNKVIRESPSAAIRGEAQARLAQVNETFALQKAHLRESREMELVRMRDAERAANMERVQRERLTIRDSLEEAHISVLRRRAAAGDQVAASELHIVQSAQSHRREQERLQAVLRSSVSSLRDKAMATQRMAELERAAAREAEAHRRAVGAGDRRQLLAGVASGAATVAGGPLAGLGVGVMTAANPAMAVAALGTAGMITGIRDSVQAFATFEHAMASVKAIARPTGDEFERLSEKALELGRNTVYTSTEAAKAMEFFAMAGFKTEKILKAIGPTLDLAASGAMDVAQAADIVAKIMSGMGVSADRVGYAVDVLTNAMVGSNTNLVQLGDAFKYVGPVAKNAGMSLEETTAAIMALSNSGMQADLAGTTLRGSILALTDATPQAQATLDRLGISVRDSSGNFRKFSHIVGDFQKKLAGLGTGERVAIIGQIFDNRQAAGFIELVSQGAEKLEEFEKQVRRLGTSGETARTKLDSLTGSIEKMSSAWDNAKIKMGDGIIGGAVRRGVDNTTENIDRAVEVQSSWLNLGKESAIGAIGGPATAGLQWLWEQNFPAEMTYAQMKVTRDAAKERNKKRMVEAWAASEKNGTSVWDELAKMRNKQGPATAPAAPIENQGDAAIERILQGSTVKEVMRKKHSAEMNDEHSQLMGLRQLERDLTTQIERQVAGKDQIARAESTRRDTLDQIAEIETKLAAKAKKIQDDFSRTIFGETANRLKEAAGQGDALAARRLAEMEVERDLQSRLESLDRINFEANTPEQVKEAVGLKLQLLSEFDAAKKKAGDEAERSANRKRADEMREIVEGADLRYLQAKADAGDKAAEVELKRLQILRDYRDELQAVDDLLRNTTLSEKERLDLIQSRETIRATRDKRLEVANRRPDVPRELAMAVNIDDRFTAAGIRFKGGQDPSVLIEKHTRTSVDEIKATRRAIVDLHDTIRRNPVADRIILSIPK